MNTVGKRGRLGEQVRCVVSVSMLTEGWDANTVTHILGVRAFGTQLLCEQVVGRALRRQSYDLNEGGLFDVEYADILGIPFDFTAKPVVVAPAPPRETVRVQAMKDRAALRISFPRVEGYRVELPEDRLTAQFTPDSVLELTPELVGDTITHNQGIVGEGVDLTVEHLGDMRRSSILFHLAHHLLYRKFRDPGEEPRLHLFGQLKSIARQWMDGGYLRCTGDTQEAQVLYREIADMACERIAAAITESQAQRPAGEGGAGPVQPHRRHRLRQLHHVEDHLDHRPDALPHQLRGLRQRLGGGVLPRRRTAPARAGLREEPESRAGSALPLRRHHAPLSAGLHRAGERRPARPAAPVVEIKGYRGENAKDKANTMRAYWVPGVNNFGRFGRWEFAEFTAVYEIEAEFGRLIDAVSLRSAA